MDYPLLSKVICLSAFSPRELRCIDSEDHAVKSVPCVVVEMTSERSNDASSNARRPSSSIRQLAKLVGASVIALHLVIGYLVGAA